MGQFFVIPEIIGVFIPGNSADCVLSLLDLITQSGIFLALPGVSAQGVAGKLGEET